MLRPTRIREKYMTWLWVILIVGVIGAIIGFLHSGDASEAAAGGIGAALGCGSVIVQIGLGVLSLFAVIWLFGWLFGGCS